MVPALLRLVLAVGFRIFVLWLSTLGPLSLGFAAWFPRYLPWSVRFACGSFSRAFLCPLLFATTVTLLVDRVVLAPWAAVGVGSPLFAVLSVF